MILDPTVERGCFITNEFELIPFDNVSKRPVSLIEASPEDWMKLADLIMEDNLYGWVHSHPHSLAIPSRTDIDFHQFPCNMIIYSVPRNHFTEWTVGDLDKLDAGHYINSKEEYKEKIIHGELKNERMGAYLPRRCELPGMRK